MSNWCRYMFMYLYVYLYPSTFAYVKMYNSFSSTKKVQINMYITGKWYMQLPQVLNGTNTRPTSVASNSTHLALQHPEPASPLMFNLNFVRTHTHTHTQRAISLPPCYLIQLRSFLTCISLQKLRPITFRPQLVNIPLEVTERR